MMIQELSIKKQLECAELSIETTGRKITLVSENLSWISIKNKTVSHGFCFIVAEHFGGIKIKSP